MKKYIAMLFPEIFGKVMHELQNDSFVIIQKYIEKCRVMSLDSVFLCRYIIFHCCKEYLLQV